MPDGSTTYPMRPAQRRIWTGQQREPDVPLYHMAFLFRLPVGIEADAWTDAFLDVVAESDALRTTVSAAEGVPVCRVLPPDRSPIRHIQLPTDPVTWAEQRCRQALPSHQRLWDAAWLSHPDDGPAWYLNLHHLITDAVSMVRVFERQLAHYRRRVGAAADTEAPPPSYVEVTDAVLCDIEPDLAEASEYWAGVCRSAAERLPLFGESGPAASTRSLRRTCRLTANQDRRMAELSTHPSLRGFTADAGRFHFFAALIAAWLSRITGERALTLDCPVHNRASPEARRTIGLFIETLPLTLEVQPGVSFLDLAASVRERSLTFLRQAHPGTPLPPGWRGAPAVLNVIPTSFPAWNGRPIPAVWVHPGHADRDHRVRIQVHDFSGVGRTVLHLDWLADVVPEPDQDRARYALRALLDAVIDDPTRNIDTVDVLRPEERAEIVVGFNQVDAGPLPTGTVVERIADSAAMRPDALAARCGEHTWTYGQLLTRSETIARALRPSPSPAGSLIGLYLPRCLDGLAAVLGVLKAGFAFVPLDPRHPPDRVRRIVEQACLQRLITVSGEVPDGFAGERLRLDALPNPGGPASAWPHIEPSDLAYVIFTSGSTGVPKGVEIEHAGLVGYLDWAERMYAPMPVAMPWFTSLSFDLTLTSLFLPLLSGGTVHIYPEGDEPVDDAVYRVFSDNRCDVIKLTPSHLSVLRQLDLDPAGLRMRALILGGEDLKTSLAAEVQQRLGPEVAIYNEYGPTEAVVGCMIHRFDPGRDRSGSVPIGRPADHVELLVVNESGEPVPCGVPGELWIARYGLARGYHRAPESTAAAFVPHPFRPGERIYRTGDRVRFSAPGSLTYLGRTDRQLKLRGLRIEPGEIEAALAAVPGVADAAVRWFPEIRPLSGPACVRCGIDESVPGVRIERGGRCNLCRRYDAIRERAQTYFRTREDLRREIDAAQAGNRSDYHCLVLVSGGKDSTYTLGQIVELGYRPLAWTLDNGYIADQALENIRRVAAHFGVDCHVETTEHMPEIFRDSLRRFSNVCQGCFKAIYTLAINRADALGIPVIVTGLSRGQFFETRLTDHLFQADGFSPQAVDDAVLAARKLYHHMDDAVNRCLDMSRFQTDDVFRRIRILDFFRYCDVNLDELLRWLREEVPWIRPEDTGRSTNCLINDVGIYVHRRERGFHNYALPYSWDVRLGQKTREEAVHELDDRIDPNRVRRILAEIDYPEPPPPRGGILAAYFTAGETLDPAPLRRRLGRFLPEAALPDAYQQLDRLPLAPSGKIDYDALPPPVLHPPAADVPDEPPATDVERRIADIWQTILQRSRIGRRHHFFDVGGHSLAAMEMMYRLCREFDVDLPLAALFETPVLCDLAERVEDAILNQIERLSDAEAEARL